MNTEDGEDKSLIRKDCIDSQFVSAEDRRFIHRTEGKNLFAFVRRTGSTALAR